MTLTYQHRLCSKQIIKLMFNLQFYRTERNNFKSLLPRINKGDNMSKPKVFRLTSTQILKDIQSNSKINQDKTHRTIKGYTIFNDIGHGGFAHVFEVKDSSGNIFALKQYDIATSLDCFHNETLLGQTLFQKAALKKQFQGHKGGKYFITFIDKFRIANQGYIVQEKGGNSLGKSLSQIKGIFVKNQRVYEVKFKEYYFELQQGALSTLMLQIALGIQFLSSVGFVHCDLKLQNILSHPTKIIDYGSAFRRECGLPKITITPQYMPPELLMMLKNTNNSNSNSPQQLRKVDVWSLGCILLEIVTGVPLWFKYKCKVRNHLQMSIFALANRDYQKLIKKQKDMVHYVTKVPFASQSFEVYRNLLKKIFVFNVQDRIDIDSLVKECEQIVQETKEYFK